MYVYIRCRRENIPQFQQILVTVTIYDCFLILSVYGVIDKCCVGGVVKWVGVRPTNQSHPCSLDYSTPLLDAVIALLKNASNNK